MNALRFPDQQADALLHQIKEMLHDFLIPSTGRQLTDKTIGAYQKALGEDYKLTTTVTDVQSVEDVKAYTAKMNTQLLANYEVSADDIGAVSICTVQVTDAKGTQLATCNLTVVQIGHTWYVDNTTADTSALYQIGK